METYVHHTLEEGDEVDAMEAAIQFWHASLARFADTSHEIELRGFFEDQVRAEIERLITTGRQPAYVATWKMTVASLMVALPDLGRALARNRVLVANARARARRAEHLQRKLDIGSYPRR